MDPQNNISRMFIALLFYALSITTTSADLIADLDVGETSGHRQRTLLDSDPPQMSGIRVDGEEVTMIAISSVWFKGMFAMNLAIFIAVMIILVIQCKQCLNRCIHNRRDQYVRIHSRKRDKYGKIELTTDVTELDDDADLI